MARLQRYHRNRTHWEAAQSFLDILYVSVVRQYRANGGNSPLAFVNALLQPLMIFAVFWLFFVILGNTGMIRGDFMLFMMTGIFLFLTHTRAVKTIKGAGHATSGMIFYAKTSALLNILASALHELYLNILSIIVIMGSAYLIRGHLEVYNPPGLLAPFFFAWASGLAVGLVALAFAPMAPGLIDAVLMVYRRAQFILSGKMLLGNLIPAFMLPFFLWNPLFHCIDQARGAAFINYAPRNSSMDTAIWITAGLIVFGLIAEFGMRAARDRGLE